MYERGLEDDDHGMSTDPRDQGLLSECLRNRADAWVDAIA